MAETRKIGNGIRKTSGRPIKVVVDPRGEYWICDKNVDLRGHDFRRAGCAPHSEVHLVK
jgi:streptogramin lyase